MNWIKLKILNQIGLKILKSNCLGIKVTDSIQRALYFIYIKNLYIFILISTFFFKKFIGNPNGPYTHKGPIEKKVTYNRGKNNTIQIEKNKKSWWALGRGNKKKKKKKLKKKTVWRRLE